MSDTRIKICGLTTVADAIAAASMGADLLGFIFYRDSPRYVAPDQVAQISRVLRAQHDHAGQSRACPRLVGVFVNESVEDMQAIVRIAHLDYAQLHSDETTSMVTALAGCAFKAIRPHSRDDGLLSAARFAPLGISAGPQLLLDTYNSTAYGGTGLPADWSLAKEIASQYPRVLLAGGLGPDNVSAAIAQVNPWGVDVSSGIEARPGHKDHEAMNAFVNAVRNRAR